MLFVCQSSAIKGIESEWDKGNITKAMQHFKGQIKPRTWITSHSYTASLAVYYIRLYQMLSARLSEWNAG